MSDQRPMDLLLQRLLIISLIGLMMGVAIFVACAGIMMVQETNLDIKMREHRP